MQLQKEVKSNSQQPSCKRSVWPPKAIVKRCKIQGGGQEIVVMSHKLMFNVTTQVILVPNPIK